MYGYMHVCIYIYIYHFVFGANIYIYIRTPTYYVPFRRLSHSKGTKIVQDTRVASFVFELLQRNGTRDGHHNPWLGGVPTETKLSCNCHTPCTQYHITCIYTYVTCILIIYIYVSYYITYIYYII